MAKLFDIALDEIGTNSATLRWKLRPSPGVAFKTRRRRYGPTSRCEYIIMSVYYRSRNKADKINAAHGIFIYIPGTMVYR